MGPPLQSAGRLFDGRRHPRRPRRGWRRPTEDWEDWTASRRSMFYISVEELLPPATGEVLLSSLSWPIELDQSVPSTIELVGVHGLGSGCDLGNAVVRSIGRR